MAKSLTDTQRVILANAGTRDDLRVLPVPTSLKKNAGAVAQSIKGLVAKGFITELAGSQTNVTVWSEQEGAGDSALVATPDGLAAIGIEVSSIEDHVPGSTAPLAANVQPSAKHRQEGTKLALVIDLLSGDQGASIGELVAATNWQAHSVRGAISGALKKKLGLQVTSVTSDDRGRVYKIVPPAARDQAVAK